MSIIRKAEEESAEHAAVKKEKKVNAAQLLENDMEILKGLELLHQKVDSMDKNNKKFLMAATMNDGRQEQLEQNIVEMKLGVIGLLDQIDVLLSAVVSSEAEALKKGLDSYYAKITEIASGLGLEEIPVINDMKFDSREQECAEVVHSEEYGDDIVVALLQRGYRDKDSGKILRCAKVTVNKK